MGNEIEIVKFKNSVRFTWRYKNMRIKNKLINKKK